MRRKQKKTVLITASVLIALVVGGYYFLYYGLGLIVNFAFLLNPSKTAPTGVVNSHGSQILTDPVLQDLPYATNSASILVSGATTPEQMVYFFQNDEKIDSIKADFDGVFVFQIYLKNGKNILFVKSTDTYSKKSRTSKKSTVQFIDTPPELSIEDNIDGKTVNSQNIDIKGSTKKEVFVQINNAPVVVRADGTFVYPFRLKEGDNQINISAADIAGNITEKVLHVKYQKE